MAERELELQKWQMAEHELHFLFPVQEYHMSLRPEEGKIKIEHLLLEIQLNTEVEEVSLCF